MGRTWVAQNYFLWNKTENAQNDGQHMAYQGAKIVAGLVAAEMANQQSTGAFADIPVNEIVTQTISYVDAADNQQKTVDVKLPVFGDVPEEESGVRTTVNADNVSVEFINESGKTAVVYVAEYNADGTLVNVTMDTFEISSDEQTETVTYAKEGTDTTVKAYVWEENQVAFEEIA